ncbi:hypothetical protein LOAG_00576 [Loa loa]|uniref:Uncharacterized protein n=1 Tax=Loa loa TaxID=7209 RepID=A0A1S0UBE4_LOALO|nr:hypothetical protein LOAG_00576 [Loa loa]EFO27915.1 hypothetical protein LOAG_00576 [Loa loa]
MRLRPMLAMAQASGRSFQLKGSIKCLFSLSATSYEKDNSSPNLGKWNLFSPEQRVGQSRHAVPQLKNPLCRLVGYTYIRNVCTERGVAPVLQFTADEDASSTLASII